MSGRGAVLPPGTGWPELRAACVAAVEATIRREVASGRGVALNARPLPWAEDPAFTVTVTRTGLRWDEQTYYVVDGDHGAGTAAQRFPVELRRSRGQVLTFDVDDAARAGLRDARGVRVFALSGLALKLARDLLDALEASSRGDLVEELWSAVPPPPLHPWAPTYLPPDRAFSPAQREALAAMTSPGARFVWGPPGTGKTTVIAAAVHHALQNGLSVLLTSHAHAAVDNVLEDLLEDRGDGLGTPEPGQVVRNAGDRSLPSVSPAIRAHPYLLLDKAAAVLCRLEEREADLARRQRQVQDAPERDQLRDLLADHDPSHHDFLLHARVALAAAGELPGAEEEHQRLVEHVQRCERASRTAQAAAPQHRPSDARLRAVRKAVTTAQDEALAAEESRTAAATAEEALTTALGKLATRRDDTAWWHLLRRHQLQQQIDAGELETATARLAVVTARQRADGKAAALTTARARAARLEQDEAAAATAESTAAELARAQHELVAQGRTVERLRRAAHSHPDAQDVVDRARAEDWEGRHDRFTRLNDVVVDLDRQQDDLARERSQLQDEMRSTRRTLLQEAPVVATTLSSLTTNPQLRERRFDVVVVDEVASADAALVVHAGSRADRTLALVGDFLQNAPIADPEDATTEEERLVVRWQAEDVFSLAGVHDRASAQAHSRCTALDLQHRFPSVVADVVNAFCYQGLLRSSRESRPTDDATIVFVDTARHPEKTLERSGKSWASPLGVRLLEAIVAHPAVDACDLGYVCPYEPQEKLARRVQRPDGGPVRAGTTHKFQGQQFRTVVFDLMQDDRPRWVGAADLRGGDRQVSAAKLLNVGLTRVRDRLFVIGDLDFVRRSPAAGMVALAGVLASAGAAGTPVIAVSADDVLAGRLVLGGVRGPGGGIRS